MTSEPSPAPQGAFEPLTGVRNFFALIGALICVFAGGCSLFFLVAYVADSSARSGQSYVNVPVILIFGGPPFLVGLLIWWLAARAGRRRIS